MVTCGMVWHRGIWLQSYTTCSGSAALCCCVARCRCHAGSPPVPLSLRNRASLTPAWPRTLLLCLLDLFRLRGRRARPSSRAQSCTPNSPRFTPPSPLTCRAPLRRSVSKASLRPLRGRRSALQLPIRDMPIRMGMRHTHAVGVKVEHVHVSFTPHRHRVVEHERQVGDVDVGRRVRGRGNGEA